MTQATKIEGGKLAIVSGASGAIGRAITEGLARLPGFQVLLVCRDRAKADRTRAAVERAVAGARLRCEIADLSRRRDVFALADRVSAPVHVLVNNAAIAPRRRELTEDGIERQFACNVLGYFWMTQAFRGHSPRGARVVNVASYWAGDLDSSDLEFSRRRYDNNAAYRQSKQCNRMLTVAFAERLRDARVWVNACHPGDVNSTLSNSLGFGGSASPEEGAETPLYLATDPALDGVTGKYFAGKREARCAFASDREAIEALYAACERYG